VLRNAESPTTKAVAQKMSNPKTSVIAIQLRITDLDGSSFDALPERAKMMINPARITPPTVSPISTQNSDVEMVGTVVVAGVVEVAKKAVTVSPFAPSSSPGASAAATRIALPESRGSRA